MILVNPLIKSVYASLMWLQRLIAALMLKEINIVISLTSLFLCLHFFIILTQIIILNYISIQEITISLQLFSER